jgi:hypothetical protein
LKPFSNAFNFLFFALGWMITTNVCQLKKRHHATMSRIRQNLFLENTFARFGHINAPFSVKTFRRMSRIWQNLFLENTFARFGHINAPNSGILTRKCAF